VADYRPATCAYCNTDTWCEKRANGKPQCRACKIERFYEYVLYAPFSYKLQRWGRDTLRRLYGTVRPENGLRQYRRGYISTAKQNGKQLSVDTPIPTPNGWRTMGDLKVGDFVFGPDGSPTPVIAKSRPDATERAFQISFRDGSSIIAGARHEWYAEKYSGQIRRIFTTQEFFEQDSPRRSNFRIPVAAPLDLPPAELPVHPYLYGFWLGNGCATKPEVTVYREDADAFVANMQRSGDRIAAMMAQAGESNVYRLPALRSVLVEHFSQKRIRPAYLRASAAQRWDLLAGLIDSDGCISTNRGQSIYATSVPGLADDVVELLRTLGVKATCNRVDSDRYGKPNAPHYRVQFTAVEDMPCSWLDRKLKRRWRKIDGSRGEFHHFTISEVAPRPMQCIQVAHPDHIYLAGPGFVPTHNSFIIGGLPIYHLLMEDEFQPEAYGVASARDQAGIVFKAAATLVEANPLLRSKLKVLESTKRIVRRDGGGIYTVLSADGDVQDGKRPSLLLFDELHRFTRKKAETVRTVLLKGMISRAPVVDGVATGEPLMLQTTTSGDEHESRLWFSEYEYAQHVIDGSIEDESYFAVIYQADPRRIESDPEYWKSREARVAANPSHEDRGGFLADKEIEKDMLEAVARPEKYGDYVRLNLNVPVVATGTPAIEMALWSSGGGDVDLRKWPVYDVDLLISKWNLAERACVVGIDFAWTTDFACVSVLFLPTEQDPTWRVLVFYWLPADAIAGLERRTRAPLTDWVRRGFLQTSPGAEIRMQDLFEKVEWAAEMFSVREVTFDRYGGVDAAATLALVPKGFVCVKIPQTLSGLSPATKAFLGAYKNRQLVHGNHPILNWNVSCMTLATDGGDQCKPEKPARDESAKRIDGVAATVTAWARAMFLSPAETESVIEVW